MNIFILFLLATLAKKYFYLRELIACLIAINAISISSSLFLKHL